MENKNILIILVVGLAVGGGVFWFVTRPKDLQKENVPEEVVGLANPASVYCEEQGGTLRNEETEQGTRGICVLLDGTECGQWSYFYGRCLANDGSSVNTFQTEDGQFSFDYPINWSQAEDLNLEEVFSKEFIDQYNLSMPLIISDPQGAQISLSVYHFDDPPEADSGTDLETVMDTLETELEKMGKPYGEISRETVGDSLVVDSAVDEQGTTMQVRDILYLGPEGEERVVYNLSFAAPQDVWGEYAQLFSYIQDSISSALPTK